MVESSNVAAPSASIMYAVPSIWAVASTVTRKLNAALPPMAATLRPEFLCHNHLRGASITVGMSDHFQLQERLLAELHRIAPRISLNSHLLMERSDYDVGICAHL